MKHNRTYDCTVVHCLVEILESFHEEKLLFRGQRQMAILRDDLLVGPVCHEPGKATGVPIGGRVIGQTPSVRMDPQGQERGLSIHQHNTVVFHKHFSHQSCNTAHIIQNKICRIQVSIFGHVMVNHSDLFCTVHKLLPCLAKPISSLSINNPNLLCHFGIKGRRRSDRKHVHVQAQELSNTRMRPTGENNKAVRPRVFLSPEFCQANSRSKRVKVRSGMGQDHVVAEGKVLQGGLL
mmetsp:Transcript_33526/g.44248  ORF Transcript_33526/g.44248 Transcript_33526/m.44248 type:complete len:236 (-) Transcript_33526:431-1138(-)